MTQYGFFIDQSRCTGCNTCTIACMQWHHIEPGRVKWMRVHQWEKGTFPNVRLHILPVMCYHCEKPVCADACPNKAISKEDKYGAVTVDPDKCRGTRKCRLACPYGAPQFESDDPGLKMSKCNMCLDRLEQGLKPICVLSCSMRALEFGPLDELMAQYGDLRQLEDMPKASTCRPAAVFKPAGAKHQVVPWSQARALELWQKRESEDGRPLPDIFGDAAEVTGASREIVGRHKLVLSARDMQAQQDNTVDDE